MQLNNVHFSEVDGALVFECKGVNYLYAGRKNGMMHGVVQDKGGVWAELLDPAEVREYDEVLETAKKRHLEITAFDVAYLQISVRKENKATVDSHDELDDVQRVSQTDCRTPDGITVGLIDGMLAMARVLRKSDLSAPEVQEALKDLQADEDMKFLMYSATLVPMAQCDTDWEFGDEQKVIVPTDEPMLIAPAAVALAKAPYKYKVHYSNKTWPMGWDQEESVKESDDLKEIQDWLLAKAEWCMMEDNGFKARIFVIGGNDGFPYSAGMLQWESDVFANKPLGWKPTLENTGIAECEWVAP